MLRLNAIKFCAKLVEFVKVVNSILILFSSRIVG